MKKLLLIILFFWQHNVIAGSDTKTLNVLVTIVNSCTMSVSDLNFGTYSALTGTTANTTINTTCTNGAAYTISANKGANSTDFNPRKMKSGDNELNYNLFTNETFSTIWGDGTGNTSTVQGTGDGTAKIITIYGKIPADQNTVQAGMYSDTINITISY